MHNNSRKTGGLNVKRFKRMLPFDYQKRYALNAILNIPSLRNKLNLLSFAQIKTSSRIALTF